MRYSVRLSEKAKPGHLYLDITENDIEAIAYEGMLSSERSELMTKLYHYLQQLYGVDVDTFTVIWGLVPNQTDHKKQLVIEALKQHPMLTADRAKMAMLKVLEKFPGRQDICSLWAKSLEWEESDVPVMTNKEWDNYYAELRRLSEVTNDD